LVAWRPRSQTRCEARRSRSTHRTSTPATSSSSVNAEKITVTGNKLDDKLYYRHSGYPGGLRSRPLRDQLERRPTEVIRKAVKGMLPRNRLARQQLNKLKVYAGPDHPHQAQDPQPLRASEDA
jgi:large subunit ribosomal protein L13